MVPPEDAVRVVLKGFAVFAATVLLLTTVSNLVKPAAAPSDGEGSNPFEEQARRLTIAPGKLPKSSAIDILKAWSRGEP